MIIVALQDGHDPDRLIDIALRQFRRISGSTLHARAEIIIVVILMDKLGPAQVDLYQLSQPCDISQCDVFRLTVGTTT